jgi:hypothetical protein
VQYNVRHDYIGIEARFTGDEICVLRMLRVIQRMCDPDVQEAFQVFFNGLLKYNNVTLRKDTLDRCYEYLRTYDLKE